MILILRSGESRAFSLLHPHTRRGRMVRSQQLLSDILYTGSELTIPVLVAHYRSTATYPVSSVEPLEALTHRSQHGAPLRYSN